MLAALSPFSPRWRPITGLHQYSTKAQQKPTGDPGEAANGLRKKLAQDEVKSRVSSYKWKSFVKLLSGWWC
jgi:hypothetical protein